ncbi:MAG: patatin-like phospholipase family protein [Parvularcula sp.]
MLSAFSKSAGEYRDEPAARRRFLRSDLLDHLRADGPKRILSLDGGGVRSAMSIAILHKIDAILRQRHGGSRQFRLSDYFDLVGGTSTGAILASLIATGKFTISEIRDVFFELARRTYGQRRFSLNANRGGRCFNDRRLRQTLSEIFGDATLGDDRIATGLAVFGKRIDTDETVIFHNNPNAAGFKTEQKSGSGFGRYLISGVLRASTGAPAQFSPSTVNLLEKPGKYSGVFVDGSVTPYNNPALQLYLLSTLPDKGFGWQVGPDALQITSIGTGALCRTIGPQEARQLRPQKRAREALTSMLDDVDHASDMMMNMISQGKGVPHQHPPFDTAAVPSAGEPQFTYQRFQARLRQDVLREELGIGLSSRQLETVRTMTNPDGLQIAYEIGQAVADHLVSIDDFKTTFDLPAVELSSPQGPTPAQEKPGLTSAPAFSALELMPEPTFPQTPSVRARMK